MPSCLVSDQGPAERTEPGSYPFSKAMLDAFTDTGAFNGREAADLDVALTLAAGGSKACCGTVEVRPFRTEEFARALPEP